MRFLRLLSASVTLYVLLIGYIVVLGIATFVEEAKGTAFVREHFYYAWWFILLQGILGIQLIVIFFELLIQAQDDISALRRAQRS